MGSGNWVSSRIGKQGAKRPPETVGFWGADSSATLAISIIGDENFDIKFSPSTKFSKISVLGNIIIILIQ